MHNSMPAELLTPDRIQEKIRWLRDDVQVCERIARSEDASMEEKGECRMRARENRREIAHWETTLEMIKNDPLF